MEALQKHYEPIRHPHLRQLLGDDPWRGGRLTAGLNPDFSKVGAPKKKFLVKTPADDCQLRKSVEPIITAATKINQQQASCLQ